MFEPRHLKAYLALVKCMHFGRAAEMRYFAADLEPADSDA